MKENCFGGKLAALRTASGMTQRELGLRLNVSGQAVSKWESGRGMPDVLTLPEIASVFGVSIEYLLKP